MKNILIFGAGRSAWFTIEYLAAKHHKSWNLMVTDASQDALDRCRNFFPSIDVVQSDVHNDEQRRKLVSGSDVVISLLPAQFHLLVAQDCLTFKKHLITPSYISPELKELEKEVLDNGLLFLNELGLDPGIDHMSAMQIIHRLKDEGATIESFKSWCGGLISKESDTNPWHYKISWNPYNIIRAGQDGGICLENSKCKYIPYSRLFGESEVISTVAAGSFDAYLNRNSLPFIELYGLKGIKTFIRGTLRYPGFGRLWQFMCNAGLTNDKITMEELNQLSWKEFFVVFMPLPEKSIAENFKVLIGVEPSPEEVSAIEWLGFNSVEKLNIGKGTPAEVIQSLLENLWKLEIGDKDRVVMVHEFIYLKGDKKYRLQSVLDLDGQDVNHTAMARTVGLPLALAAELLIHEKIQTKGVLLPIIPEIYEPLMKSLINSGIYFKEIEEEIN